MANLKNYLIAGFVALTVCSSTPKDNHFECQKVEDRITDGNVKAVFKKLPEVGSLCDNITYNDLKFSIAKNFPVLKQPD